MNGKMEDKTKRFARNALLIFVAAAAIAVLLALLKGQMTGVAALQTFEFAPHVNAASAGSSISFEEVPDFKAKVGEQVRLQVNPNEQGVDFSDDTHLFNITSQGVIEFVPKEEDVGHHRVLIFIKKNHQEFYAQDVHIIIEE